MRERYLNKFMDNKLKSMILNDFGEADYDLVLSELESITLRHVMANSESQLETARFLILEESKGDLARLASMVALAKIDIRDILIYASKPK